MTIRIIPNATSNPPGKLADAELHFPDEPAMVGYHPALAGLKLIGFAIWERRTGGGRNVTFPARQYAINGERRSFALLRPTGHDADAQARVRDLILDAYAAYEQSLRLNDPPITETPREAAASHTTTTQETDPPVGQDDPLTRGTKAHQDARQADATRAQVAAAHDNRLDF